jgi:YD repeat-containing protein
MGEFTYVNQTIQTGFSGITVLGPQNNSQISVLRSVKLVDGSSYEFTYNNYGQVYQIKSLAADTHELARVKYIMDSPTADCPRFTERRDYAENWNGGQEAVTTFSAPTAANWTMPDDNASFTGKVCQVTTPDNTATKVYYSSSGWNDGLSLLNETVADAVIQKWVRTKWTQDNESLSYQQNPRVKETIIGDPAGNRKRTIVTYQSFTPSAGSSYYLPVDVSEGDATTIWRHSKTDYNTSSVYTSLHIIGLPDTVQLFEGAGETVLLSKVSYKYDEAYSLTTDESNYLASQANLIQHDSSYGTGTTPKRANLTSIHRWDVEHSSTETLVAVNSFGYDIAGSIIFVKDALNHKMSIRATDAYSAGNIVANTFAYPTMVTNAGGFSTTSTYNYDTGVVTKVTNPLGAQVVSQYDDFGRLTRKTLRDGLAGQQGADITYMSYEYLPSGTEVRAYTLLDVVDGAEVKSFSLQRFDGVGRVIGMANNHPGSQGQYSGQRMQYDVMGRLAEQTNPTEINDPRGVAVSSWTPAGDDAVIGWKSITQAYDWKGRSTLTTNVDFTTKQASYEGCGCAGGEKVTLTDEAGKTQNLYHDVLGRVVKTEVLNMDANHSVYTTVVNTYNARDQITNIRQYEGTDTSTTYQDTVMTYDGHGRLLSRKVPEQTSATIYSYYADDMLESVMDARMAVTSYTYNSRHLVTAINYTVPSSVAPTANVAFRL